jgi:hypothetical protein
LKVSAQLARYLQHQLDTPASLHASHSTKLSSAAITSPDSLRPHQHRRDLAGHECRAVIVPSMSVHQWKITQVAQERSTAGHKTRGNTTGHRKNHLSFLLPLPTEFVVGVDATVGAMITLPFLTMCVRMRRTTAPNVSSLYQTRINEPRDRS